MRLIVGADALNANVDGQSLAELCKSLACDLELRGLSATNSQVKRGLHAKAIIGIHQHGSWCLAGSANITRPALLDSWRGHGNMETVVFRTAADPKAFEVLWQDELITFQSLSILDAVINEEEPKEQSAIQVIRLVDLVARDNEIQGQVVFNKAIAVQELKLSLCLSNTQYLLALDDHNRFSVRLERPLLGPEAAVLWVLCDDNTLLISAETFIDQLYELEHYGARSFHRSMHSKLELIPDAARTFKELMDFLFQRTDRASFHNGKIRHGKNKRERHISEAVENEDDERDDLPASAFITNDELTFYIGRRIDTLNPFDRDHYSLRDLLSLALLRLTTETTPSRVLEASVENEEDEQVISEEVEEQRQIQRTWQEWLVQYLTSYCRRYSQRLQDASFLLDTGPELLLQNHHTLVRVLLEFHARTEAFTSQLLRETVRQIWAPFFKSSGVISTLGSEDLD